MKTKSIPELDKLFLEIGTYKKSNEFKELFEFVKKFPRIAPYNAMLIHIQKPGSQYIATASEWVKRFNRTIKPGARPLVILRPFGPVAFVFELGDTIGKDPFPQELLNPFNVLGKLADTDYNNLVNNVMSDGVRYCLADHCPASAGYIEVDTNKIEEIIVRNKKEISVRILYNLVVNRSHSQETKFATVLHELGHLYCGHLGTPNSKWWNDRHYVRQNVMEFEAESVCWLICERMGIKNPSAEYLSGYLDNHDEIPDISIDAVLKSVGIIETMINGGREPRKELITSITKIQ